MTTEVEKNIENNRILEKENIIELKVITGTEKNRKE